MEGFRKDVVVSLGKYFWSRKDKAIINKGAKRTREGAFKQVPTQIIWKSDSSDTKQDAFDTKPTMGAFTGANFDSIS